MVDASGSVAIHTGADCIAFAGHVTGEQVSCQANIMVSEGVWPAMLAAYQDASGPLAHRLLAALDAAEAFGGDARGRQSAALLVVPASGPWWRRTVDLRVEDHAQPLAELRRLLGVHDAYSLAERAEALDANGDHDAAIELRQQSLALSPENHELRFWSALACAQAGDLETALVDLRAAVAMRPAWADVLRPDARVDLAGRANPRRRAGALLTPPCAVRLTAPPAAPPGSVPTADRPRVWPPTAPPQRAPGAGASYQGR